MTPEDLGQAAYEAWRKQVPGINYPEWSSLRPEDTQTWINIASAVQDQLEMAEFNKPAPTPEEIDEALKVFRAEMLRKMRRDYASKVSNIDTQLSEAIDSGRVGLGNAYLILRHVPKDRQADFIESAQMYNERKLLEVLKTEGF